jgi:hypothetical protein
MQTKHSINFKYIIIVVLVLLLPIVVVTIGFIKPDPIELKVLTLGSQQYKPGSSVSMSLRVTNKGFLPLFVTPIRTEEDLSCCSQGPEKVTIGPRSSVTIQFQATLPTDGSQHELIPLRVFRIVGNKKVVYQDVCKLNIEPLRNNTSRQNQRQWR